jgi:hypothetical protein
MVYSFFAHFGAAPSIWVRGSPTESRFSCQTLNFVLVFIFVLVAVFIAFGRGRAAIIDICISVYIAFVMSVCALSVVLTLGIDVGAALYRVGN